MTSMAVSISVARLFTTVGVHPTRCGEFEVPEAGSPEEHLDRLLCLAAENRDKVVAIGECGLGKESAYSAEVWLQGPSSGGVF